MGRSLSLLLFVFCMIPLTSLLRKVTVSYEYVDKEFRINHLLFINDLILFAKNQGQIDSLVQTVHFFRKDIRMEIGVSKSDVLVLKRGKVVQPTGLVLPDGQMMRENDENILWVLWEWIRLKKKKTDIKERFASEYKRRLKLVLKSKLNGNNKVLAINMWTASILRYGAGEKGGLGLISCEGCVESEKNNLERYVKNYAESLIQGVRLAEVTLKVFSVRMNSRGYG